MKDFKFSKDGSVQGIAMDLMVSVNALANTAGFQLKTLCAVLGKEDFLTLAEELVRSAIEESDEVKKAMRKNIRRVDKEQR